jgi:hypothetical protein
VGADAGLRMVVERDRIDGPQLMISPHQVRTRRRHR